MYRESLKTNKQLEHKNRFQIIHKTKLDLRFVSLRNPIFLFYLFIYLFENDFYVPVVCLFSNFPCTLFLCVRSSNMMRYFFWPLKLKKTKNSFSLKTSQKVDHGLPRGVSPIFSLSNSGSTCFAF